MKETVYWLAKFTGIFALCRWLTRKDIRILCYHGIWMGEDHFGNFLFMSPEKFARRTRQLVQLGFPLVSLHDALEGQRLNALANCSVVVTIDDGWYGSYCHMLPVLRESGIPATIYMTTYYCEKRLPVADVVLQYMLSRTSLNVINIDQLGNGKDEKISLETHDHRVRAHKILSEILDQLESVQTREQFLTGIGDLLGISYRKIKSNKLFDLMTIEQVAECARQGVDIQLHSHRHRIYHLGKSTIEKELPDNRARLEPLLDRPLRDFCYPSGIYDESIWPELAKLGIRSATTTEAGFVRASTHRYALPRILDGQDVSDLEFEAELSGFGEIKRRLQRAIFRTPR